MKSGTKSILFGVHQFLIHPLFVFVAWIALYRKLPKLHEIFAIITHDLGLWGLPNIDGDEGETHPMIMYDWWMDSWIRWVFWDAEFRRKVANEILGHSGYYCEKMDIERSKLYKPDKLSVSFYPICLYLLLATLSGEIQEYMELAKSGKYSALEQKKSKLMWFLETRSYMTLKAVTNRHHISQILKADEHNET